MSYNLVEAFDQLQVHPLAEVERGVICRCVAACVWNGLFPNIYVGVLLCDVICVQYLVGLSSLSCVYLEHNPIYRDFEYRKTIAATLPKLQQLDANQILR